MKKSNFNFNYTFKYTPYSYSKISTFKNCPYRFKLQYIDKIKTKFNKTPALEKGSFLHYGIEHYLKGNLKDEINKYNFEVSGKDDIINYKKQLKQILKGENVQIYKSFNKNNVYIEEGFGLYWKNINDKWQFELGKYSKQSTIYGYIDLMIYDDFLERVNIIDHKSGKFRKDQDELQLKIYAIVGFLKFPDVNDVYVQFDFLEHNKSINFKFERKDFDKISYEVIQKIIEVENEENFNKKDTFCNWCPYYNEGHCNGKDIPIVEEMSINSIKI